MAESAIEKIQRFCPLYCHLLVTRIRDSCYPGKNTSCIKFVADKYEIPISYVIVVAINSKNMPNTLNSGEAGSYGRSVCFVIHKH